MARIETDTITAPAYWASALVNGDASGLEPQEAARVRSFERRLSADGWSVADVARDDETGDAAEPQFTWRYRLYDIDADCDGGEVLDYIVIKSA